MCQVLKDISLPLSTLMNMTEGQKKDCFDGLNVASTYVGPPALRAVRELVRFMSEGPRSDGCGPGSSYRPTAASAAQSSAQAAADPAEAAHAASSTPLGHPLGMYEWELIQAELLLDLPEEIWGLRPCSNFECTRLEGPCELTLKTLLCEGGCGARYCCPGCQEEAWRGGHRHNCEAMRTMRDIYLQQA